MRDRGRHCLQRSHSRGSRALIRFRAHDCVGEGRGPFSDDAWQEGGWSSYGACKGGVFGDTLAGCMDYMFSICSEVCWDLAAFKVSLLGKNERLCLRRCDRVLCFDRRAGLGDGHCRQVGGYCGVDRLPDGGRVSSLGHDCRDSSELVGEVVSTIDLVVAAADLRRAFFDFCFLVLARQKPPQITKRKAKYLLCFSSLLPAGEAPVVRTDKVIGSSQTMKRIVSRSWVLNVNW